MNEATLGLGGNLGDPVAAFARALRELDAHPLIARGAISAVYRTPPWGRTDQPDFLNMAAAVRTGLGAGALLSFCLLIETASGRVRTDRWGPRTLDIDLLTYAGATIDEPGLQVPHPRMAGRAFVLVPLAEIAPELVVGGRSVAALCAGVDATGVERDAGATARLGTLLR